jgi:NADPH:quinone reductase-like Zn-dependent oxidoreductase
MSRIVRFHSLGGPEVLQIEDVATPQPGPGEVSLSVKAFGINRADELFRTGNYTPAVLPSRIGYEAAGIVTDVGPGDNGFVRGDIVSVIPTAGGIGSYGTYGERATVPAYSLVKHPPFLSFVEAAAVWMQYVTAYGALVEMAGLAAGEAVVINAASSSVGLAAIQVANLLGAIPIATTRSGAKRQALLEAGAAHVIATQEEDVRALLAEITNGRGARVIFDPVGGPAVATFIEAMSAGGIFIFYGVLDPEPISFQPVPFLFKALRLAAYRIGDLTVVPDRLERAKRFILGGLESGKLRPIVAKTFAFDQIVDAHRYLESNEQFGKIVVTV